MIVTMQSLTRKFPITARIEYLCEKKEEEGTILNSDFSPPQILIGPNLDKIVHYKPGK
jgi:hypothetical protein